MMQEKEINWLIIKEFQGDINDKEKSILENWKNKNSQNKKIYSDTIKILDKIPELRIYSKIDMEENWNKINSRIKPQRTLYKRVIKYWQIAASLIIIIGIATLIINDIHKEKAKYNHQLAHKIKPGKSKAYLEFADGEIVELDSLINKKLKQVDGVVISAKKSIISYNATSKSRKLENITHTLKIPRGGEYELELSDGTKVWLNSETTLKYPATFASNERVVYMEGEAYFEVTRNINCPFRVKTKLADIKVLGTSFNVKAYPDKNVSTTTLVNGKVAIKNNNTNQEYTIAPNEQATCFYNETNIQSVNVDQYIAWKNGRILFEENTLEEIMDDLARWYDIDIFYQNPGVKNLRFSIDIKKYENFEVILDMLSLTKKVTFNINNKSIIVMEP